jgi:hypothetical protein
VNVGLLILGAVFGLCGYRSSVGYQRKHGYTPWRLPSWAWGLIGFLSLLLCAVLFLIASKTTKPAAPADTLGLVPPEGWYPDPTGEHELRYWDGTIWTDRIEDAGVTGVAPLTTTA